MFGHLIRFMRVGRTENLSAPIGYTYIQKCAFVLAMCIIISMLVHLYSRIYMQISMFLIVCLKIRVYIYISVCGYVYLCDHLEYVDRNMHGYLRASTSFCVIACVRVSVRVCASRIRTKDMHTCTSHIQAHMWMRIVYIQVLL